MVFGMATTKITITLQDDQVEEIRALVAAGQACREQEKILPAMIQKPVEGQDDR